MQSLQILNGVQIDSIYTAGISNSWVLSNLSNWWIQLGKKIGVLLGDVCSSCNQLKLIKKKKEADPLKCERKFKEKGFLVRRESLDVTEGTLR